MEEYSHLKKSKLKKYPNIKSIDLTKSHLQDQSSTNLHSQRKTIDMKSSQRNQRFSHNMHQLYSIQNKYQNINATCELPKLPKMSSSRFADEKQNWQKESARYNIKFQQTKKQWLNKSTNYAQNLKKSMRESQVQNYIDRISIIREKGTQLQKSTSDMINKARHANNVMSKKYGKLSQNSNSILTGIQEYCLQEQRNKKYKKDIRQMWMKYDR